MASSSSTAAAGKRRRVDQALLAETSCSKSAIARILMKLHENGVLVDGALRDSSFRSLRGDLGRSAQALADGNTPFGPVLQSTTLPCRPPFRWDYVSPTALVYKLSEVSPGFRSLMMEVVGKLQPAEPLKLVLYVDECRPGDVLRPDKGRATPHILWTFADFPEWLLVRDHGWFTFGCIRSSSIETLPSSMSNLMKFVVHAFDEFASTGGMVSGTPPFPSRPPSAESSGMKKALKRSSGQKAQVGRNLA